MRGSRDYLDLGERIDLELALAADRAADPHTIVERDTRIGRRILAQGPVRSRVQLVRCWLDALRSEGVSVDGGDAVVRAYRFVGIALSLITVVAGSGTARAILAYDGTDPVNLVHFLAVFVGGQLALVALSLFLMSPLARNRVGAAQEIVRALVRRGLGWLGMRGRGKTDALLARMNTLGALYGRLERWLLLRITQQAAVFFNLGALATCLYLVAFTDLAFGWSTSLDIESTAMARLLRALALPWSWTGIGVPTTELVEVSRYFRKGAAYDPRVLKDWWPFLIAALATYGLLPRLVLWQVATWRLRATLRRLPLDYAECEALCERLLRHGRTWRASPASALAAPAVSTRAVFAPPAGDGFGALHGSRVCAAVVWADARVDEESARALVADRFGWPLCMFAQATGRRRDDERLLAELAALPDDAAVLVLVEAWEPPSRGLMRLLRDLRERVGGRRAIVVGLLGGDDGKSMAPAPEDRDVWKERLATLADPYLRVEPMVEA